MVTPQIVNYIRQNLAAGLVKEDIEKALLGAGWAAQDITDGFNTIEHPKISMSSQSTSTPAQDDSATETARIQNELELEARRQKWRATTANTPVVGGIIGWLIAKKIVEGELQANLSLLGVAIIATVLAVGIYIWSSNSSPTKPPAPSIDGTFTHQL